ncbi:Shikimate kinase [Pseudoalteromonas sp. P1-13-1a]|uniref:adenylate kinase n=1 Tax=Pseudoalteromonas sp. P1-13-1a TaxID=1723756 RepID=UPI0006E523CD|nr:adenylate kinase [Pseudoalteromonas sp. P1-13-1a]KPZ57294.1 Shikimate kinase [Pseudoalteromonas sp. P1-13-1a]
MNRINVIGTSGSGKSHFSRRLAEKLDVPYIEMDAIFWLPNWEHLETKDFLLELQSLMEQKKWVLDGNQSKTNTLKWRYVDTIVWLDYSFFHTFKQILFRSLKRSWSKQEIWEGTGNRESFRRNFLSSKSVILWMLQNYWKTKQKYTKLFVSELADSVKVIRIKSPKQAELFLANA